MRDDGIRLHDDLVFLRGLIPRIEQQQRGAAAAEGAEANFEIQYNQLNQQFLALQQQMTILNRGINVLRQQAERLQWRRRETAERMAQAVAHLRRQGTYYLQLGEEQIALRPLLMAPQEEDEADTGAFGDDPEVAAAAGSMIVAPRPVAAIKALGTRINESLRANAGRGQIAGLIEDAQTVLRREQREQEEMIRQGRRTPTDSCNGDDDVEYEFVDHPGHGHDAATGMGQLQLESR